jgi:hypothetical protein
MLPRTLATIIVALYAVGLISAVGLIFSSPHPAGLMYIAFLCILTATALPFVVSVRCPIPGCNGIMERSWRQDSNGSKSLTYQCRICGEFYDMPVHYGRGDYY